MCESGIYIRVGAENLLLEEMSIKDREEWLNGLTKEALIRTINILCNIICENKDNSRTTSYKLGDKDYENR